MQLDVIAKQLRLILTLMLLLMFAIFVVSTARLFVGSANASGFDNQGIGSLDLIFDPARFAVEGSYTAQFRNVEYEAHDPGKNGGIDPDQLNPVTGGAQKAMATPNVWNYQAAAKVSLTDNLRCLARINQPGSILEELPEDWNGKFTTVKTELNSFGVDGTCGVRVPVAPGQFLSVFAGARYVDVDLYSSKMNAIADALGLGDRLTEIELSGSGYGWRVGAAFEVPEYAIRANIFYDSAIDIDATGTLNTNTFLGISDIESSFTMPQGVEFRVQSGIAPRWLAFAGVKWVNWSVLDQISVPSPFGAAAKVYDFADGWTVTGGVGHQLTDKIQVGSSLTWDQGIGGPYSDTYQVGLGGSYKVNDNVTWSIGGALVYKTATSNQVQRGTLTPISGPEEGNTFDLDRFNLGYDASVNFGLTTKLKLTF